MTRTPTRTLHRLCLAAVAWALCLGLAAPAARADWNWKLTGDQIQLLTAFEEQQYKKAEKLVDSRKFDAAAAEFEKFRVRFEDSDLIPYVLFLQAHSLHKAAKRNNAIRMYQQVIDYFGYDINAAAPAKYWQGKAHLDNGDTLKGLKVMQQMVEHPDYKYHPLAAGALRYLADNHWTKEEYEPAIRYYKQIWDDFYRENKQAVQHAENMIIGWYVWQKDYDGFEDWYVGDDVRVGKTRLQMEAAKRAWDVAHHGFAGDWGGRYPNTRIREKRDDMEAFYKYFQRRREEFERSANIWDWYDRAIQFTVYRHGGPNNTYRDELIDEALAYIAKQYDGEPEQANKKYVWLGDRLRDIKQFEKAKFCYSKLTDPNLYAWKSYEMTGRYEGKWQDAVKFLEQIEASGNEEWVMRAQREHANVFKDRLGKYDEAIKLYRIINDPPWSIWQIVDAHLRAKQHEQAVTRLREMENFFPKEASQAAYKIAKIKEGNGDKDGAIASWRRILKVYPGSREASRSHQDLERYGIETGGGVMDEADLK